MKNTRFAILIFLSIQGMMNKMEARNNFNFTSQPTFSNLNEKVYCADLNGDGKDDILYFNALTGV